MDVLNLGPICPDYKDSDVIRLCELNQIFMTIPAVGYRGDLKLQWIFIESMPCMLQRAT
jgi:hypothetical protein